MAAWAIAFLQLPAATAASLDTTFATFTAGSALTVDHSKWSELLKRYVKPGADGVNAVDYSGFKGGGAHQQLKSYVAALSTVEVAGLDRPEQMAFWINLYNAKTIDIVLDHYPIKSIKDISLGGGLVALVTGGPWKAKTMNLGGMELSLDDIEHGILRPVFKDPRIHYAVNCASIGCPNLMMTAFTAAALEQMLDSGAVAYINHPRGIDVVDGAVKASSIYDWFQSDFGDSPAGVLAHARKFASAELKAKLAGIETIDSFDYDWRLNEAKP